MFKPLLLAAILAATVLPAAQQAHAEGISIDLMPGVSLRIGDQDNRGRYWDGYDWRDRDWWQGHQGRYLGDRSRRGYYWDGYRWRDPRWWADHHRYERPRGYYYGPPPRVIYYGPPRRDWRDRPHYRMPPPPPPGYYYRPGPRW